MVSFVRSSPAVRDTALLLLRLMFGVMFIYHGAQKVFGAWGGPGIDGFAGMLGGMNVPFPYVAAWLSALTEFVGGISVLFGAGMRLILLPLIFNMIVAVHATWSGGFSRMELPLSCLVTFVALLLLGPGRFSVDGLFSKGRK